MSMVLDDLHNKINCKNEKLCKETIKMKYIYLPSLESSVFFNFYQSQTNA